MIQIRQGTAQIDRAGHAEMDGQRRASRQRIGFLNSSTQRAGAAIGRANAVAGRSVWFIAQIVDDVLRRTARNRHHKRYCTADTARRAVAHRQRRAVCRSRCSARHRQDDGGSEQRNVGHIHKTCGVGRRAVINAVLVRAVGACGVRQVRAGRAGEDRWVCAQRDRRRGVQGDHHVVAAGRAGRVAHCPAEGVNTGRRDAHAGGGRTGRAEVGSAGAADLRPDARADAGRVGGQRSALAAQGGIVARSGGGRGLVEAHRHLVGAGRAGRVGDRPAQEVSRARISRKSGSRAAGVAESTAATALDAPHACAYGGRVGGQGNLGLPAGGRAGLVITCSREGGVAGREGDVHVVGAGRAGRVAHCPAEGVNTGRRDVYTGGGRTGRAEVGSARAADLRPGARADAGRVGGQRGALAAQGGIVARSGGGRIWGRSPPRRRCWPRKGGFVTVQRKV